MSTAYQLTGHHPDREKGESLCLQCGGVVRRSGNFYFHTGQFVISLKAETSKHGVIKKPSCSITLHLASSVESADYQRKVDEKLADFKRLAEG